MHGLRSEPKPDAATGPRPAASPPTPPAAARCDVRFKRRTRTPIFPWDAVRLRQRRVGQAADASAGSPLPSAWAAPARPTQHARGRRHGLGTTWRWWSGRRLRSRGGRRCTWTDRAACSPKVWRGPRPPADSRWAAQRQRQRQHFHHFRLYGRALVPEELGSAGHPRGRPKPPWSSPPTAGTTRSRRLPTPGSAPRREPSL